MSTYYLASEDGATIPVVVPPARVWPSIPTIMLESMDGLVQIPLSGGSGWIRMPGATGLEMPPYEHIGGKIPGVAGGVLLDTRVDVRPVFLPIHLSTGSDHLAFLRQIALLRRLVDPTIGQFKVIGRTDLGEREMHVTYVSGLEGIDSIDMQGLTWAKFGIAGNAYEPFAMAREARTLEFRMAPAGNPFLGVAGGTDAPWPEIALSSGSVIGSGMDVTIDSDVEVWPTLELVGPMDSFTGTLSPIVIEADGTVNSHEGHEWSVSIPAGVPAGQTFLMVTDPRMRSIRLDGALASGRVALGSTLRPFYPGRNQLNVIAPGGNDDTRIRLSWRNLYRSIWAG